MSQSTPLVTVSDTFPSSGCTVEDSKSVPMLCEDIIPMGATM